MVIIWVFLSVLGTGTLPAQDSADRQGPTDIEILKLSWSRVTNHPRGSSRPGPSSSNASSTNQTPPTRGNAGTAGSKQTDYYIYSARIKNLGSRAIKAVAWEYRIIDPGTSKELARHPFWTHIGLGTNKTVTLEGGSVSPPSNVVSVAGLEKNRRSPFLELAVIKCVIYADGALWKSPAADQKDCDRFGNGVNRN